MKEKYIDLMEKVLSAYSYEQIFKYFDEVKKNGISEHGFPRLTANLGILISKGRKKDLIDTFIKMMDFCCYTFTQPKKDGMGNDFSVKEIIFALMELEKSDVIPRDKILYWKDMLKSIKYEECYNVFATSDDDKVNNWALYTATSEFMRDYIGLCDSSYFVDVQISNQLKYLDENKMYRDPNEPMLYDIVSRTLFAILLHFGYKGKYYNELNECLKTAGLLTLDMQSVTGEIPFGGRSNQFLHNEGLAIILYEFEASRYFKEGDLVKASKFKNAANNALSFLIYWLEKEPVSHIKNRYPIDSGYGCEFYAHFNKYMVTTASWLYVAYVLCNDDIPVCDIKEEPLAFSLSKHFHKTFLKNNDYFVEIDDNADSHYDASGIGRIHLKGAPTPICLSVPGTATPSYKIDGEDIIDFSIMPGIIENSLVFANRDNAKYNLKELKNKNGIVSALYDIKFKEETINLYCEINKDCVNIKVDGKNEVLLMLPAFSFDGSSSTKIINENNIMEVYYEGYVCRYTSSSDIIPLNETSFNRNGRYDIFYTKGNKCLTVYVKIEKV